MVTKATKSTKRAPTKRAPAKRAPAKRAPAKQASRRGPRATLSIDVGGTGIKASVLDHAGRFEHSRVRIPTPYPLSPDVLISSITELVKPLPRFDRVSLGFPGLVRHGHVLSAPHFVSPKGPDGKPSKELVQAWDGYDLQHSLGAALKKPARVANDADVQGSDVIKGDGLEVVLTLGTGLGSAVFNEGRLAPHLELSTHPFRGGRTYNEVVGEEARKELGNKRWRKHVGEAVATVRELVRFDHCYIGGGNASKLKKLTFPDDISVVDNQAGILGGMMLWERTD
jgi:polyphosphate glucokinase